MARISKDISIIEDNWPTGPYDDLLSRISASEVSLGITWTSNPKIWKLQSGRNRIQSCLAIRKQLEYVLENKLNLCLAVRKGLGQLLDNKS